MIARLRMMVTCHWSAQRIHRYLDSDPSLPLSGAEVRKLEAHLAVCERCLEAAQDFRLISQALRRMSAQRPPDQASVARVRDLVEQLSTGQCP